MTIPQKEERPEEIAGLSRFKASLHRGWIEVTLAAVKAAYERSTRLLNAELVARGVPWTERRPVFEALRQSREELETALRQPGAFEELHAQAISLGLVPSLIRGTPPDPPLRGAIVKPQESPTPEVSNG